MYCIKAALVGGRASTLGKQFTASIVNNIIDGASAVVEYIGVGMGGGGGGGGGGGSSPPQ